MMTGSTEVVDSSSLFPVTSFAWVGTVLVNIAFISLISWGAATLWPLGCALCSLYAFALFSLARYVDEHQNSRVGTLPVPQEEEHVENRRTDVHPKYPILVSLLYGLAVIAMGVTGSFLSDNLFSCSHDSSEPDSYGEWKS